MADYKKSEYIVSQKIYEGAYLCSNFFSGKHIVLSEELFDIFNDPHCQIDSLACSYPKFYSRLKEGGFIVESSLDEFLKIQTNMITDIKDKSLYHIIINPTLDCNLSCWYCYENKVPHSRMSKEVMDGICKHIEEYYITNPFKVLKLSFFGGEPLLFPNIPKIRNYHPIHD